MASAPPPPDAEPAVALLDAQQRDHAAFIVNNVGADTAKVLYGRTGDVLKLAPGYCSLVLEFKADNCPKSENALQRFMAGHALDHGMTLPKFVAVPTFMPLSFLCVFHIEDASSMQTLITLLNASLNGVETHLGDISELSKKRVDGAGKPLFGKAFIGAMRLAQKVAFSIGATKMYVQRGQANPRQGFMDLSRNMEKFERDSFAATISQILANIAVKLPVLVKEIVDADIEACFPDFLPGHVCDELKRKRDEHIKRLSAATVSAHVNHAAKNAASAAAVVAASAAATAASATASAAAQAPGTPTAGQTASPHTPPAPPAAAAPPLPIAIDLSAVADVQKTVDQENLQMLKDLGGSSSKARRTALRTKAFDEARSGLSEAFGIPLMPARKRLREGESASVQQWNEDRLFAERKAFTNAHASAMAGISTVSDPPFEKLMRILKSNGISLVNRGAKIVTSDIKESNRESAEELAAALQKSADEAAVTAEVRAADAAADANLQKTTEEKEGSAAGMDDGASGSSPTFSTVAKDLDAAGNKTARTLKRLTKATAAAQLAADEQSAAAAAVAVCDLQNANGVGPDGAPVEVEAAKKLRTAARLSQALAIRKSVVASKNLRVLRNSAESIYEKFVDARDALVDLVDNDEGDISTEDEVEARELFGNDHVVERLFSANFAKVDAFMSGFVDPTPDVHAESELSQLVQDLQEGEEEMDITMADLRARTDDDASDSASLSTDDEMELDADEPTQPAAESPGDAADTRIGTTERPASAPPS